MVMATEDRGHRERIIMPDGLGIGYWERAVVDVTPPVFEKFPKIPRFNRQWIITEKIDGTNAQVFVDTFHDRVVAGSRNRWLRPGKEDNFGFASWVAEHEVELYELGGGRHFGEWYGSGIGRHYDLPYRRFTLFNTTRWHWLFNGGENTRPECCGVVPVLAICPNLADMAFMVEHSLETLRVAGSVAVVGYMRPEGIVVYHPQSNHSFKVTLEHDAVTKGDRGPKPPNA